MFLLFLGSSVYLLTQGLEKGLPAFWTPSAVEQQEAVTKETITQFGDEVRASVGVPTESAGFDDHWRGNVNDELVLDLGAGFSDRPTTGSGLYWDELRGSPHCIAYGTRRYTARLRNVSFWVNRTRACMETPIQINDVTLSSPDECEVNVSSFVSWAARL